MKLESRLFLRLSERALIVVAMSGLALLGCVQRPGVVAIVADDGGATLSTKYYESNFLTVDASGNAYAIDPVAKAIVKIGGDGKFVPLSAVTDVRTAFNTPGGIVVDKAGNLFISDESAHVIFKATSDGLVSIHAGNYGKSGHENGKAMSATFDAPSGLAIDKDGTLYVAERDSHSIRKVSVDGTVSDVVAKAYSRQDDHSGYAFSFDEPTDIAVDGAGNIFVSDHVHHVIRRIDPTGRVGIFAGMEDEVGVQDGVGQAARFNEPRGIAIDRNGALLVADHGNFAVRRVDSKGEVETVAKRGQGSDALGDVSAIAAAKDGDIYVGGHRNQVLHILDQHYHVRSVFVRKGTGQGQGTTYLNLRQPTGIAIDGTGKIQIAEMFNGDIRLVSPNGVVTSMRATFPATLMRETSLQNAIAIDRNGNTFVIDQRLREIRRVSTAGQVKRIPLSNLGLTNDALAPEPQAIAIDREGNLLVAASSSGKAPDSWIVRLTPDLKKHVLLHTKRTQTDFAEACHAGDLLDVRAIAVDSKNTIYVSDGACNAVRKIDESGGLVKFFGDPSATPQAIPNSAIQPLRFPNGLAIDDKDNVWIADTENKVVWRVAPNGKGTIMAGRYDGEARNAAGRPGTFEKPTALAIGKSNIVYVLSGRSLLSITQ